MKFAPIPDNDQARIAELRQLLLLDTLPERVFDELTRLASQICEAPMSLINLIDEDRQWAKAKVGIDFKESERRYSICGHTILEKKPLVINDVNLDERFSDNPYLGGEGGIRFYAGSPLITNRGFAIGSLCVLDTKPRTLNPVQLDGLETIGRLVTQVIEERTRRLELLRLIDGLNVSQVEADHKQTLAQLTNRMAHEVNNPMAIILGALEMIRLKTKDEQSFGFEFASIKNAADRIANIFSTLSSFVKERDQEHSKRFCPYAALQRAFETDLILDRPLALVVSPGERELLSTAEVQGSPEDLDFVLMELAKYLARAQATVPGSELRLRVKPSARHLELVFEVPQFAVSVAPDLSSRSGVESEASSGNLSILGLVYARALLRYSGGDLGFQEKPFLSLRVHL